MDDKEAMDWLAKELDTARATGERLMRACDKARRQQNRTKKQIRTIEQRLREGITKFVKNPGWQTALIYAEMIERAEKAEAERDEVRAKTEHDPKWRACRYRFDGGATYPGG